MSIHPAAPFRRALELWRGDRALLLPVAGLFMFVPQWAVLMLVPDMPRAVPPDADDAALRAWTEAVVTWAGQHGPWYLLAPALALAGSLAIMALYLDPARPSLGGALRRAALLFLRYLLASILVALPAGALLMPALASPLLLVAVLAPIFYLFGRTMLAGPVIVAEAPVGAVAAVARSWRLTTGHGWVLAACYGAIMLGAQMVGGLFLQLGEAGGANPVIRALTDGLAAAATATAALTLVLVEVALYRRLASSGT
ncbi:hypothetical protein SAMN06297144_0077 [Sphingomonas guangdongensis]|uniref:Uncharacterized protein n=1 Tax=Sphingomonas guangdongensis TaxID=1141890 RepID=A0A285Q9R4_9SPHN|nr:hypothetical protein [Sphingomonas guangdongensis]SOB78571.1 hypothetical protein SAMN06297144_0077 [Sphingomonas guangdongensis]